MTSYEYTIYELHYYVDYTHEYKDGTIVVQTGDEQVSYFHSWERLMDELDELKKHYDGTKETHGYGITYERLSKATYIEVRSTKRVFAVV